MTINIDQLIPVALPRHFILTVYPNGDYKITERKRPSCEPKRDKAGRFTSDFTIRLRQKRRAIKETCAYAEVCPFRASTSIEEI